MKKLLTILTAIGIFGSTASVVACSKTDSTKRFSTPTLDETLRDKILVSLLNDSDNNLSNITNGKRFNDIDFQNVILKMVQDQVSKISNQYYKNQTNELLHLNTIDDFYQNQIDDIASDIAQNQFYLEYTNSQLTNPATSKDEELNIGASNLYTLNPQNLLTNDNEEGTARQDSNKYFIFMHEADEDTGKPTTTNTWIRWQYAGENDPDSDDQLPTINELQNNQFIILRNTTTNPLTDTIDLSNIIDDATKLFYKDEDGNPVAGDEQIVYSKDGLTPYFMNGSTALEYRFQEYFTTKIKNNYFENLLTMSYLDSNFYNIFRNESTSSKQDAFLNISSNLGQTIQTWNKTDGYKSKLKMVWSFTLKDDQTVRDAWTSIGSNLRTDGSLIDSSQKTLESIYQTLTGVQENDSNLGTDPFFNFNGYNGLVKNDGESVTSVDGNLMVSDAAKTMIAQANAPTILTADYKGQGFVSGTKQNEYDYIFVLPIYLVDLLNDRTSGFDNGQSTTGFVKTEDITNNLPTKIYSSYSKSKNESNVGVSDSKKTEITTNIAQTNNFYLYVGGVPYTVSDFNRNFQTNLVDDATIWSNLPQDKNIEGLQFNLANSIGTTIGNIGINHEVKLGTYTQPNDDLDKGITFSTRNNQLYVTATKQSLVGEVVDYSDYGFKLSFDDGSKDGLYTINGTINETNNDNNGKTYSYKVNMGANASSPSGYLDDGSFHFYRQNISSLDISNLSTDKKDSLLREIQFITSKESGVNDVAAAAIYPLFLEENSILYTPLYDTLKNYLVDENGGTSD